MFFLRNKPPCFSSQFKSEHDRENITIFLSLFSLFFILIPLNSFVLLFVYHVIFLEFWLGQSINCSTDGSIKWA